MESVGQIHDVRGGMGAREAGSSRIAPARGIAVALALGGLGWAAIAATVLLVRSLLGA